MFNLVQHICDNKLPKTDKEQDTPGDDKDYNNNDNINNYNYNHYSSNKKMQLNMANI